MSVFILLTIVCITTSDMLLLEVHRACLLNRSCSDRQPPIKPRKWHCCKRRQLEIESIMLYEHSNSKSPPCFGYLTALKEEWRPKFELQRASAVQWTRLVSYPPVILEDQRKSHQSVDRLRRTHLCHHGHHFHHLNQTPTPSAPCRPSSRNKNSHAAHQPSTSPSSSPQSHQSGTTSVHSSHPCESPRTDPLAQLLASSRGPCRLRWRWHRDGGLLVLAPLCGRASCNGSDLWIDLVNVVNSEKD